MLQLKSAKRVNTNSKVQLTRRTRNLNTEDMQKLLVSDVRSIWNFCFQQRKK